MNATPTILLLFLLTEGAFPAPPGVDKSNQTSEVKLEASVSGHLEELNGKFKLRASETVYQPGGYIGEHHHVGPGIRYVASGELTYIQGEKTTVYKKGDYFYESGDITHTAINKTSQPVMIINFELLRRDWNGSSAVLPPAIPNQPEAAKKP
jgi:quercetin dioxygenase-like cupin family protein